MFLFFVHCGRCWRVQRCWAQQSPTPPRRKPLPPLRRHSPSATLCSPTFPFAPFTKITGVTGGWANHVGVVIDVSGDEPLIAESKVAAVKDHAAVVLRCDARITTALSVLR